MDLAELGIIFVTEGADAAIAKMAEFEKASAEVVQTDEERIKSAGKLATATSGLSDQITRSIIAYNGTKSAVYEYQAIVLGANDALRDQIAILKGLEEQEQTIANLKKLDIQLSKDEAAAAKQAAAEAEKAERAKWDAISAAADARAKDIKMYTQQEAERVALAKKTEQDIADAKHKALLETMNERQRMINLYIKQEQDRVKEEEKAAKELAATNKKAADDAIKQAEAKALGEMAWAKKSRDEQLRIKKEIAEHKDAGISDATISSTFGPAAVEGTVNKVATLAEKWNHVTLNTSRARSEMVVLAHEAVQGRFSRIPASMMVFAEYTDITALALSGLGLAIMGAVAALAVLSIGMVKGMLEQRELQNALIMTGNYAGVSEAKMHEFANSITASTGSIEVVNDVLSELTSTGKFTFDQMKNIASAVKTVVEATGGGDQEVSKLTDAFKSLAVEANAHSRYSDEVSKQALKLDNQYHFLTASVYANLRALEAEGNTKQASIVATNELARVTEERGLQMRDNLSYIEKGWRGVTHSITQAWHAVKEWGRVGDLNSQLKTAAETLKEFDKPLLKAAIWASPNGDIATQKANATKEYLKLQEAVLRQEQDIERKSEESRIRNEANNATAQITLFNQQSKADKLSLLATKQEEYNNQLERQRAGLALDKAAGKDTTALEAMLTDEYIAKYKASLVKQYGEKAKVVKEFDTIALDSFVKTQNIEFATAEKHAGKMVQQKREQLALFTQIEADKFAVARANAAKQDKTVGADAYIAQYQILKDAAEKSAAEQKKIYTDLEAAGAKRTAAIIEQEEATTRATGKGQKEKTAAIKAANDQQEALRLKTIDLVAGVASGEEGAKAKAASELYKMQNADLNKIVNTLETTLAKEEKRLQTLTSSKEFTASLAAAEHAFAEQAMKDQLDLLEIKRAAATASGDEQKVAAYDLEISKVKEIIGLRQRLKDVGDQLASASAPTFGEMLKDQLAGANKELLQLVAVFDDFSKQNDNFDKQRKALKDNKGVSEADKIKLNTQLMEEQTKSQVASYGKMASAAKGFFEKNTDGYKAMEAIEKVTHLVAMADIVAKMMGYTAFLGVKISGDQAAASSGSAAALSEIPAQAALNTVKGVGAVLGQGQGDPYSAFGRMAAMAAIVVGLGVMLGGGVGGGGGGGAAPPTQAELDQTARNEGKGTILGDKDAVSKSIEKSLSLLTDLAKPELANSSRMVALLTSINSNLGGTTNALLQSGLDTSTTGRSFGSSESQNVSFGTPKTFVDWMTNLDPFNISGAIFGGSKTSQTGGDTGLSFGKGSVNDLISNPAVRSFMDIITTTDSKGFLGTNPTTEHKTDRTYGSQDSDLNSNVSRVAGDLLKLTTTAGKYLGANDANIKLAGEMPTGLTDIKLNGLKPEEITAKLQAVFSAMGDKMAKTVMPGLEAFQAAGEGYLETLLRVSSSVEYATNINDKLGISTVSLANIQNKQGNVATEMVRDSIVNAESTFKQVSVSLGNWMGTAVTTVMTVIDTTSGIGDIIQNFTGSADELADLYNGLVDVRVELVAMGYSANTVSAALLKGAGGIDALASGLSDFQTGFLTETEQLAVKQATMDAEFKKLGLTTPKTAEEFKKLVLGLKGGDAASQKLLGSLLVLSGGMTDLFEAAADPDGKIAKAAALAQTNDNLMDRLAVASKKQTSQEISRRKELAEATDVTSKAILKQIYAQEDAAEASTSFGKYLTASGKLIAQSLNFNGSVEDAQQLAYATDAMFTNSLKLIEQINAVAATSSAKFADSIRTIQLDVLDNEGKYAFYNKEATKYRDILKTMTDPDQIAKYSDLLNKSITSAWGVLTTEQKKATSGEFVTLLEGADALTKERFGASVLAVETANTNMGNSVKTAIADAMAQFLARDAASRVTTANTTAAAITSAATVLQTAAATPVQVNVAITVPAGVQSELTTTPTVRAGGGGGGGGRSTVGEIRLK